MHQRLVTTITVLLVAARIVAAPQPAATCAQLTRLESAELMSIVTNRFNTTQPVTDVISSLWCESNNTHVAVSSHFNVTLIRPMVVYGVSTRGNCRGNNSFVKKFTISYISNEDSQATVIPTVSMCSVSLLCLASSLYIVLLMQDFQVSSSSPVYFFLSPMITDGLQFTIQDAVADSSGQYCWHLDIFVCNVTTSSPTATASQYYDSYTRHSTHYNYKNNYA